MLGWGEQELLGKPVHAAIHEARTNPANIAFEITETALMGNIEAGEVLARGLSAIGCQVVCRPIAPWRKFWREFPNAILYTRNTERVTVGILPNDLGPVRGQLGSHTPTTVGGPMSSSPNGSATATRDRPTDSERRNARIAGIFFVITFISILALPLYDQVLNHHHFIVGGSGDVRVELGALCEIITLIAGIGTAVALYPVLRRQSEGLALGYVTVRVVESALIAVGIVSLLAIVTLRQDLAGAAGTDNTSLILNGRSLVAVHDATFLLGPAFCSAIGNGLMLGYMLFRSGLVPRRFAQFGMVAGSLALVTAILVLFGAYKQVSGPSGILTLPEAAWELSLGIYLIVKGFRPDASLFERHQRDSGADDRAFRPGERAASVRAEPAGV
jgi:hypothetical protein